MNLRSYYSYNTKIRNLLSTDLHLFELSVWIQAFAQSLIAVFIPIILWRLGFSIKEIITFYFIFNLIDLPMNIVARNLIVKYGARIVLIISIVANLIYLITLYNLSTSWMEVLILAAALAVFDSFYWVSHLYIFEQSAHNSEKIRHDVSALNIVRTVGGLFAPAIGAYILIVANQQTLIFFSTILMFASLIPLFRMRHLKFKPEIKPLSFKEFFRQPVEKVNFFFEALGALQAEVEDVIWPFFVFFLFQSVRPVAYIAITISFAGLILTYITGKYSIKRNIYQFVSIGGLVLAMLWIVRWINPVNPVILYSSVFLIAFTAILVDLPLDVAVFERGKTTDILNASTYRNFFRMMARCLLYFWLLFAPQLIFRNSLAMVITAMLVLFVFSAIVAFRVDKLFQFKPEPIDIEK